MWPLLTSLFLIFLKVLWYCVVVMSAVQWKFDPFWIYFERKIITWITVSSWTSTCGHFSPDLPNPDKGKSGGSRKCLFNYSLHSKRFQSSYCAKVRAEAKKKRWKGEVRRGNACPQTPRFWKTPLDISVWFVCKLTACQNRSITNRLPLDCQSCKVTLFSNRTCSRRLQKL